MPIKQKCQYSVSAVNIELCVRDKLTLCGKHLSIRKEYYPGGFWEAASNPNGIYPHASEPALSSWLTAPPPSHPVVLGGNQGFFSGCPLSSLTLVHRCSHSCSPHLGPLWSIPCTALVQVVSHLVCCSNLSGFSDFLPVLNYPPLWPVTFLKN